MKATGRRYTRRVWLDGLNERDREAVLQDRVETREEEVFGLEPRRWAQVATFFAGEAGSDVLYCLARGLNTHATATYLNTSERTIRNVANRYLDRLRAIQIGAGGVQTQMFDLPAPILQDEFAPARRPPTKRGRPRQGAQPEVKVEKTIEMCY